MSALNLCSKLECLEFSGGIWSKNKVKTLEPISHLPLLNSLKLLNLSIVTNGLKPLVYLPAIKDLECSNQFSTEDFAYLSVKLPHTKCNYFSPYVEISKPVGEKNVMVTGKRKPFLNKSRDSKKLESYVKQFEALRNKYSIDSIS